MTTSSTMIPLPRSSSFLTTELAISLATFGLVTAIVTGFEKHKRRQQQRRSSTSITKPPRQHQHHMYHPPSRIVRYLQEHSGKKWQHYSVELEEFVRTCPKVELHVHLDGSLDPDFLWHCLQKYEKQSPGSWVSCLPVSETLPWDTQRPLRVRHLVQQCQNVNDFHTLCTCRRGERSLQNMLTCFSIFLPLIQNAPPTLFLLEELAYDFCRRQWEQNIIYTEVRYCPHSLMNESKDEEEDNTNDNTKKKERLQSAREVMQAITRGLQRGCQDFDGIVVNQILCAINWRPDWAWDVLSLAEEFFHQNDKQPSCGVVGIDIAAGEEHFDDQNYPQLYQDHYDMIQDAKAKGIPIAIHAGETPNGGLHHVRKAVEQYGAKRIGHGYRMTESVELMQQLANDNNKVHVEICPTSSVETGGWILKEPPAPEQQQQRKPWKEHPGLIMMKYGIPISLNSDDPAVFHTSLSWQYRIALVKMGLTPQQILQTSLHAIEASFGRSQEKSRVKKILQNYLNQLASGGISGINSSNANDDGRFTDRVRDPF